MIWRDQIFLKDINASETYDRKYIDGEETTLAIKYLQNHSSENFFTQVIFKARNKYTKESQII